VGEDQEARGWKIEWLARLMDYDATEIPLAYDRGRTHGPEVLDLWMRTIERYLDDLPLGKILDLGCGTGRFSDALASWFSASVIGVDPSRKMLEQARGKLRKPAVTYVRGAAEALPLRENSCDFIFMSMVFHHFSDAGVVAGECRRVLRDGQIAFLRAGTIEQIPAYPYVGFIPETKPLLYERLNAGRAIRDTFEAAGFSTVATEVVVQQIAPTYGAYADKLAAGGDSILASLNEQDLENGLRALRRHAALVDPQPVTEPIDVFVFRR
jgi:ubiquinone/menaquinone biosynthesis C-methylase UbiE